MEAKKPATSEACAVELGETGQPVELGETMPELHNTTFQTDHFVRPVPIKEQTPGPSTELFVDRPISPQSAEVQPVTYTELFPEIFNNSSLNEARSSGPDFPKKPPTKEQSELYPELLATPLRFRTEDILRVSKQRCFKPFKRRTQRRNIITPTFSTRCRSKTHHMDDNNT